MCIGHGKDCGIADNIAVETRCVRVILLTPSPCAIGVKPVAVANPSVAAVQGAAEPFVQITATWVPLDFQVTSLVISLVDWWPA